MSSAASWPADATEAKGGGRSLQEVADAFVELSTADQIRVLGILPTRAAAAVFEYLSTPVQRALLTELRRMISPSC